jgi:hypothetical protein
MKGRPAQLEDVAGSGPLRGSRVSKRLRSAHLLPPKPVSQTGRTPPRQKLQAFETKIFFIGFNKTATVALHSLMRANGLASLHWRTEGEPFGRFAALEIEARLAEKAALRDFLAGWTAFSDLTYLSERVYLEGNQHFRLFHELYEDAFFVLNDRPTEDWVRSRCTHGDFLGRCSRALSLPEEAVKTRWRAMMEQHRQSAMDYFKDYPRFLHFRIDRDDISELVGFLRPRFTIKSEFWKVYNATEAEATGGAAVTAEAPVPTSSSGGR